jgi:hypothetical protein
MILIWVILIILSSFAIFHLITLIYSKSKINDIISFFVMYLFFIGFLGWLAIGVSVEVKTYEVKLNKKYINITRTKTSTIITYKDLLYQEFNDAKTYLYCNKDSCDFDMYLKINMYNYINNKEKINIKYK